jgi:hypothetical protein
VSTPEQVRLNQPQGGDDSVSSAYADRESRLAADEASLAAGRAPGHDEQLTYHEGRPTVAEQMQTHGQVPPRTPDTGGHG